MSIILHNDRLTAVIDEVGAQLCSVKNAAGTEYIWQADPAVWGRHAPLLFPVIARMRDGQYTHGGKVWNIASHGFARDSRFEVVETAADRAVFRLTHSEATLSVYPFPFVLTVTYTLADNRLVKTCRVENPGDGALLYELGGHDGFIAPLEEGAAMDDYAVVIPGLEAITPYGMDASNTLTPKSVTYPLEGGRIPLKPSVYGLDTVMLDELPQRRASLVDKAGKARVTLDFADFPYLGIWTMASERDTNYVCIEPWTSLPDATFVGRELADKAGIRTLAPGAAEELTYTTTFD